MTSQMIDEDRGYKLSPRETQKYSAVVETVVNKAMKCSVGSLPARGVSDPFARGWADASNMTGVFENSLGYFFYHFEYFVRYKEFESPEIMKVAGMEYARGWVANRNCLNATFE